jgi:hypothetical protein
VAELFTDINKAEPVKDVDLPGVASATERDTLASAVSALRTAYPEMFKVWRERGRGRERERVIE